MFKFLGYFIFILEKKVFPKTKLMNLDSHNTSPPEEDEFITESYALHQCPECESTNCFSDVHNDDSYAVFSRDVFDTEERVCHNCGSIFNLDDLHVVISERKISKHDAYIRSRKDTYEREAHLNERIRQHMCMEPSISRKHLEIIRLHWKNDWKRTIICKSAKLEYARSLRKENVQSFLRSLDEKRWRLKEETDEKRKKYFCAKYLEKWKTIKKLAIENESENNEKYIPTYWTIEEINLIVDVFLKFSAAWNLLQPPKMKYRKKENWVFLERKHFPNFNFMIRRCCEILEIEYDKNDWPIPKSSKCINNLNVYFRCMCKVLRLKELTGPFQQKLDKAFPPPPPRQPIKRTATTFLAPPAKRLKQKEISEFLKK